MPDPWDSYEPLLLRGVYSSPQDAINDMVVSLPSIQRVQRQCSEDSSHGRGDYRAGNGAYFCRACYQRLPRCAYCGDHRPGVEQVGNDPDERLCPACRQDYTRPCVICDTPTVNTAWLTEQDREPSRICRPCYRRLPRCQWCDRAVPAHHRAGAPCGCCIRNRVRERLHDYTYKPNPVFHGRGPTFLGWELEVSTPPTEGALTAMDLVSADGDLMYPKYDSSIVNGGFELVTHPMSYSWAVSRFPWDMLRQLADLGCSGEGNGLHVHVSRRAFSSSVHLYSWLALYYRNAHSVETLARRRSSEWAPFHRSDRQNIKHYAKGELSSDRHRAINTENSTTLEVRVFESSLEPVQVKAALGLVHASVAYTRQLSAHDVAANHGWDWPRFMDWCSQRDRYAPLTSEWERLGR